MTIKNVRTDASNSDLQSHVQAGGTSSKPSSNPESPLPQIVSIPNNMCERSASDTALDARAPKEAAANLPNTIEASQPTSRAQSDNNTGIVMANSMVARWDDIEQATASLYNRGIFIAQNSEDSAELGRAAQAVFNHAMSVQRERIESASSTVVQVKAAADNCKDTQTKSLLNQLHEQLIKHILNLNEMHKYECEMSDLQDTADAVLESLKPDDDLTDMTLRTQFSNQIQGLDQDLQILGSVQNFIEKSVLQSLTALIDAAGGTTVSGLDLADLHKDFTRAVSMQNKYKL